MDMGIVHHIGTLHAGGDGGVHDDGAHQVSHVGSLAAGQVDADAEVSHLLQELLCAVDNGADNFAGNQVFVAPDSGGEEDVVDRAHAQQVVQIHHHRVDGDAFPHAHVARFLPVQIGQRRLGAGAVSVHDVAVGGVATHEIGYNLAERLWEKTLVDVLDGVVHILFRGRHAAQVIFQCIHDYLLLSVPNVSAALTLLSMASDTLIT